MSNQTRLTLVVRSIVPLHKVIPIEILGAHHLAKEFGNFSFKSSGNFLENALGNHGLPPEVFLFFRSNGSWEISLQFERIFVFQGPVA